jgi:hypothetical protein
MGSLPDGMHGGRRITLPLAEAGAAARAAAMGVGVVAMVATEAGVMAMAAMVARVAQRVRGTTKAR